MSVTHPGLETHAAVSGNGFRPIADYGLLAEATYKF